MREDIEAVTTLHRDVSDPRSALGARAGRSCHLVIAPAGLRADGMFHVKRGADHVIALGWTAELVDGVASWCGRPHAVGTRGPTQQRRDQRTRGGGALRVTAMQRPDRRERVSRPGCDERQRLLSSFRPRPRLRGLGACLPASYLGPVGQGRVVGAGVGVSCGSRGSTEGRPASFSRCTDGCSADPVSAGAGLRPRHARALCSGVHRGRVGAGDGVIALPRRDPACLAALSRVGSGTPGGSPGRHPSSGSCAVQTIMQGPFARRADTSPIVTPPPASGQVGDDDTPARRKRTSSSSRDRREGARLTWFQTVSVPARFRPEVGRPAR